MKYHLKSEVQISDQVLHFSSSGGSSSGSGDTETCSEEGGEEEEEEEDLVNQNGVEDLSREVVDNTREVLVTGVEERLLAGSEKFVREEVHHLVNEGSPPYYRGARGMP